jgi:cytoskeletal protein RodZ
LCKTWYNALMEKKEKTHAQSKQKENFIIALIFIFLVSLTLAAGYWVWQELKPKDTKNTTSIEKLVDETSREEAKAEDINNEEKKEKKDNPKEEEILPAYINIKVLNGGAISGAAAKVKNTLVVEGYSKTETGNAKARGYKGVTIYYFEKFENEVQKIEGILKKSYQLIEKKKGMNEQEVNGDIVIILGK